MGGELPPELPPSLAGAPPPLAPPRRRSTPRRPALLVALAALSGALLGPPLGSLAPLCGSGAAWLAILGLTSLALAGWAARRGSPPLALAATGAAFCLLATPAPPPRVVPGVVRTAVEVLAEGSRRPGGIYSLPAETLDRRLPIVLSGRSPAPLPGEQLVVVGFLKAPTAFQAPRGAAARIQVTRIESQKPGLGLTAFRGALRRALGDALQEGAPRQHRLLASVLLGGGQVRQKEREAFSATGTAHLLSISGLHVAILAGLALLTLRALGWGPTAQRLGVAALLLAYLAVVGPRAATLRATIASLAWLLAPGRSDAFNRLACALFVVVAWDPSAPSSLGFQLSFGTVTGMILLGRLWRPRAWLARHLVGGALAFLASSPLLAARLGQVPWAALWLGPPALALFAVILGLALFGALLGVVHPLLGAPALGAADVLASLLVATIEACAEHAPADRLLVPNPILVALALGALAWGAVRREAGRSSALLLGAGTILCLSWTTPPPALGTRDELRVLPHARGAWVESPIGLIQLGSRPRWQDRSHAHSVLGGRRVSDWTTRALDRGALLYTRGPWRVLWVPQGGPLELGEPVDVIVTRLRGPIQLRRLRAHLRPGAPPEALVTCSPQASGQPPIVVPGRGG